MDVSDAVGVLSGERFRNSLDDGREVWLDGERIKNVAEHPAFRGTVEEMARLFDLRLTEPVLDVNTTVSAETGNRISWSYVPPRTVEELQAKFAAAQWWMRESFGQLGRSPDFMANVVVGIYDFRDELEAHRPGFGGHAIDYHRYVTEHDLVLTHALGDPQIDRSTSALDDPDLALRVVAENDRGVVLRGAKQLATLAPFAHEVLVYLNGVTATRGGEQFTIWFALPMNTPGLKTLCREPLGDHRTGHSHPFARRYDEQDAMLFFDDVEVPWERVFLLGDAQLALRGLGRINAWSMQSTHIRFYERLRVSLSVAAMLAHSTGVDAFRGIQENLGEIVTYAETMRLAMAGAATAPVRTPGGLLAPAPSMALGIWGAEISERVAQIVRRIGASGLIMQPSEADLASPELRPFLERYMRGHDIGVDQKSRLFRIAWDLVADGFGSRQELYEYLHRGDPGATKTRLLRAYDRSEVDARLRTLLESPLPS